MVEYVGAHHLAFGACDQDGADPVYGHWPETEVVPEDEREINPGAGFEGF